LEKIMKSVLPSVALIAALAWGASAHAHVVLSPSQAPAGSSLIADFRVMHGCEGAATTGLRIEIPQQIPGVKPQPKPGWTLTIERAPAAAGAKDGRVTAVSWTGGMLPDDEWDEFGLSVRLPGAAGPLSFAAVQSCGQTEVRWAGAPAHPAPTLTLTPATEAAGDGMSGMPMGH
jgi:hypothetical protein